MELTVHIPDDIAERLGNAVNDDLSRRALEGEREALKSLGF